MIQGFNPFFWVVSSDDVANCGCVFAIFGEVQMVFLKNVTLQGDVPGS